MNMLLKEFMDLNSQLTENSSPWFSDGTRWPFVIELRKQHDPINVNDLEEDTTYVTCDNGSGIYRNGTSVGYFTAPSVIVTGKFETIKGRKQLQATIYGGTFHVTSNPGIGNQSATWTTTNCSKAQGHIFIDEPFCPPTVRKIEDAIKTLKEYLKKVTA